MIHSASSALRATRHLFSYHTRDSENCRVSMPNVGIMHVADRMLPEITASCCGFETEDSHVRQIPGLIVKRVLTIRKTEDLWKIRVRIRVAGIRPGIFFRTRQPVVNYTNLQKPQTLLEKIPYLFRNEICANRNLQCKNVAIFRT